MTTKAKENFETTTDLDLGLDTRVLNGDQESDSDYRGNNRPSTPRAPRPNRVQTRPAAPQRPKESTLNNGKRGDDLMYQMFDTIKELKDSNVELKANMALLLEEFTDVKNQLQVTTKQLAETKLQLSKIEDQLNKIPTTPASYASILARPASPLSGLNQPDPKLTVSSTPASILCTIDTSRMGGDEENVQPNRVRQEIEKEMRADKERQHWRCLAVIKDPKNPARIRITCRNEAEQNLIKNATSNLVQSGARVLQDQLYPVKIDNANRTAIMDQEGKLLPGIIERLSIENDVKIAKIGWLSKRDSGKAYGSMVIYVTTQNAAVRLLQGVYFHVAGESACTSPFERKTKPQQCYQCQELGHKAYSCRKPKICAKCAEKGHHHSQCQVVILKCTLCGGPHESFSRNCHVLYPPRHE